MIDWTGKRNNENPKEPEPESQGGHGSKHSDLEIEKKWLNLIKVDGAQFDRFYNKYYEPILTFVFLEIRNQETAQEITNDVFTVAVDKLDSFRWQGYTFGAWLFQIARNLIGREKRRLFNSPEVAISGEFPEAEDPTRADEGLIEWEEYQILGFCLDKLEPQRQEVFRAYYFSGLLVREIAVILDISEASVKAHLRRGRRKLLRYLLEMGMERGLSAQNMKLVKEWTIQEEGWDLVGDKDSSSGDENKPTRQRRSKK